MPIQVILAILLIIFLWFATRSKSTDKLARFWKKSKYPTKWDIQQKYPKTKSLQQQSIERKRREEKAKYEAERTRKQRIIDRHIRELKEKSLEKSTGSELIIIPKSDIPEANSNGQDKLALDISDSNLDSNFQISSNNLQIPPKLLEILIKMVNGREDVALRLVQKNLKRYPEMSPAWACKKVILDLERYIKTK